MGNTKSGGHSSGERTMLGRAIAAEEGLSLVEVLVAMIILVVGLLGLAQVFYMGLRSVSGSSNAVIAREKAREAIESVHAARDMGTVDWAEVRNDVAPTDCPVDTEPNGGGVFLQGMVRIGAPGADGLVNTDDDTDTEIAPGRDNVFGTGDDLGDDIVLPPTFQRQISICDVPDNPNLRLIVVTIRYVTSRPETYTLTSYVSKFA